LRGIAAGLQVRGIGCVHYHFPRPEGGVVTVKLDNVLYVPDCLMRLLCPRHVAAATRQKGDGFRSLDSHSILTCYGVSLHVDYEEKTKLPIIYCFTDQSNSTPFMAAPAIETSKPDLTKPSTGMPAWSKPNLSQVQHLKLLMHERCNHRHMADISKWIRQGLLPVSPSIANCPDPICHACQLGKAHRRPHNKATGGITANASHPGEGVSADQLEAGCPGRIPTTKGLPTTKRYRYCNLWIDHVTRFVFPTFHETKHANELIASKREFQQFAARFNVIIRRIRADNGVYSAAAFQHDCAANNQELTFCAVGSHWQNGVAERHIGLLTQTARTLLVHATTKWPAVINEKFWPFAVKHACAFHNASVHSETKQIPHYAFTGEQPPCSMSGFRVFGCPVFVLDKRLQDGDSVSKWKARSWTGVYVGNSAQHAGTVPLVYNPQTTHVTPQYHVTFDDAFMTVSGGAAALPDSTYQRLFNSDEWLFKSSFYDDLNQHLFDTYWQSPPPHRSSSSPRQRSHRFRKQPPSSPPSECLSISGKCPVEHPITHTFPPLLALNQAPHLAGDPALHTAGDQAVQSAGDHAVQVVNELVIPRNGDQAAPSAGAQAIRNAGDHAALTYGDQAVPRDGEHAASITDVDATYLAGDQAVQIVADSAILDDDKPALSHPIVNPYINLIPVACSATLAHYMQQNGITAHVYTAHSTQSSASAGPSANPPDSLSETPSNHLLSSIVEADHTLPRAPEADNKNDIITQSQMLKTPDKHSFVQSQADEIASLQELDIMDVRPIASLPPRARLLSSIWSYRRKRLPNGVLVKYKARLCVNGKEQAFGRDYWETYAPVAAWSTIRFLLYLSTILNLKTRQVDYTSAFPQAALDIPVYMKVPQGWFVSAGGELRQHEDPKYQDASHYLRLKKNLYGCKQAARNWFRHLKDGLLKAGFTQSTTDTCLFLRDDCIIIIYVDDCLFFSPSSTVIDGVIKTLSQTLKLKDEGDVAAFLGVNIARDVATKKIAFTQPGLIDQIIRDVGLTAHSKHKDTPSDSILHPDTAGPRRVENWSYRSVIGKLNYLANNTRPDISMSVHQCARFCSAPRALH
jgi:hypothetical protein